MGGTDPFPPPLGWAGFCRFLALASLSLAGLCMYLGRSLILSMALVIPGVVLACPVLALSGLEITFDCPGWHTGTGQQGLV